MKSVVLFGLIFLFFLISCDNGKEESGKASNSSSAQESDDLNPNKKEFLAFLANFKEAKLPMEHKDFDFSPEKLPVLSTEDYPNYAKDGPLTPYGYIKLNNDKVALIIYYHADTYLVGIRTYTNDGLLINEEQITLGYCGADVCYTCDEKTVINKDLSLICTYSFTVTDCEGDNSLLEKESITRKGVLLRNGSIKLEKEVTKQFIKPRKLPQDTTAN